MTDQPEDVDRPGKKGKSGQKPEDRKKHPDRSGHLPWRIDDVEHHGIEPSEGPQIKIIQDLEEQ